MQPCKESGSLASTPEEKSWLDHIVHALVHLCILLCILRSSLTVKPLTSVAMRTDMCIHYCCH